MMHISPPTGAGGQPSAPERPPPMLLPGTYPAISLNQPWAGAIFFHGKRIENRVRPLPPKYLNTPVLIHATIKRNVQAALRMLSERGVIITPDELHYGAIVGSVMFRACHYSGSTSECGWGQANYWWWEIASALAVVRPFPCRGHQGWFTVTTTRLVEVARCEEAPNPKLKHGEETKLCP